MYRYRHFESEEEHLAAVAQWLEENVRKYPTPRVVQLYRFEIDWSELSGWFAVKLDDVDLQGRFQFWTDIVGRQQVSVPIFTSPLGAPASYEAVELTGETYAAIQTAISKTFPKVKPFGRDPSTGRFIDSGTPFKERIVDPEAYNAAKESITAAFSLTLTIEPRDFTSVEGL